MLGNYENSLKISTLRIDRAYCPVSFPETKLLCNSGKNLVESGFQSTLVQSSLSRFLSFVPNIFSGIDISFTVFVSRYTKLNSHWDSIANIRKLENVKGIKKLGR